MLVDKYNEGYSYSSLVVDKDNNPTATTAFIRRFNFDNDKVMNITLSNSLSQYKDNGTYKMYFNILNKKKVVVKKVAIEITKKLPEFPAAFSAKANQFDAEGAKVVDSVLMPGVLVEEGAEIYKAIVDEGVVIKAKKVVNKEAKTVELVSDNAK